MKFNSQICTTREQSETLLSLGLKKETADMVLLKEMVYDEENYCTRDGEGYLIRPIDYLEGEEHRGHIPAWSLHRLIEMALRDILICGISFTFNEDAYEKVIRIIGHQIKIGYFNKEYLEKKKKEYPKTYEECCKVMDYALKGETIIGYKASLLRSFQKLLVCRDAYWKIAGEEMGLGKPWKPDYDSGVDKFGIICLNGIIQESDPTAYWVRHLNKVLDFPTKEMRDAFYENFKDLIEQCKELL